MNEIDNSEDKNKIEIGDEVCLSGGYRCILVRLEYDAAYVVPKTHPNTKPQPVPASKLRKVVNGECL